MKVGETGRWEPGEREVGTGRGGMETSREEGEDWERRGWNGREAGEKWEREVETGREGGEQQCSIR